MKSVYLFGAGPMAEAYAKVLRGLSITPTVIGRGAESAKRFTDNTGLAVELTMPSNFTAHDYCIIAVGVEGLAGIAKELLVRGAKRILVEKPGGLNVEEMQEIEFLRKQENANISIAYNRRFYASVQKAKELIKQDGGVRSMNFEFTEWSHVISPLVKAPGVKEAWLLANSTHVIDLAFYLSGGKVNDMKSFAEGYLDWHKGASKFTGAGKTTNGVVFSYMADWEGPGRWGVEILTYKHRLVFRPLESLIVQHIGSVQQEKLIIEDSLDLEYKPGLYLQTKAFLEGTHADEFLSLEEQIINTREVYAVILQGGEYKAS